MLQQTDLDELLEEAVLLFQDTDFVSSSIIQRRLSIGYARAARILDQLTELGVVGPANGSKPRRVLKKNIGKNFDPNKILQEILLDKPIKNIKWIGKKIIASDFVLELGQNEQKAVVKFDLEKYANLILIGSQLTGTTKLINRIVSDKIAEKSPEELKMIIADGFKQSLVLPTSDPYLLTPIITDPSSFHSALKWLCMEIDKRLDLAPTELAKSNLIFLVINSFNSFNYPWGGEIEEALSTVFKFGKTARVFALVSFDFLDKKLRKDLFVSVGARLVFKPTTPQLARSAGVPAAFKLASPDEAILSTMWDGQEKITVKKKQFDK